MSRSAGRSRRKDRLPGILISLVMLTLIIVFVILLMYTDLVPMQYIGIIFAVLLLFLILVYFLVKRYRKKVRFWIGTVLMLALSACMCAGGVYVYKTTSTLQAITNVNTETAEINVYVLSEDPAQSIQDMTGYSFGILKSLDRDNTDNALQQISMETGISLNTVEYDSLTELADSLTKGDCGAVLLNRAYLDVLDQLDGYSTFSSGVRQISSKKVETVVERKDPDQTDSSDNSTESAQTEDTSSAGEVYTIYISGIDTRGAMTSSSLSDVNIIATINTKTHQVLLVSTPRDYYVPLSISNGVKDKLTHAGVYGVNVCMDTLEMLYDININYYFRLNFQGFIKIVDALGGVDVYSEYDFDNQNGGSYHFNKGYNHMNGDQALAFCRERYAFSSGDRQRGRNQMAVIQGILDKAISPELLKNYVSVLDSLTGCFESNVPYDVISALAKKQLTDGSSWKVLNYSVDGTGDKQTTYSMNQLLYVMNPDMTTVEKAKDLMQKARDGITLSEADTSVVTESDTSAASETNSSAVTEAETTAAQ